jgi:membrane protein required for colicin V production
MEYVDLIFGAILAFFIILGSAKGLFREVFGLIGFLGGIIAGILYTGPLSHWLAEKIPSIPFLIIPIVSFLILFIAVYLLSRLLADWFSSIFEALHLKWLNKLLGGIVGGFKGAILLSMLLLILSALPLQSFLDPIRGKSYFYIPLQSLLPALYSIFSSTPNGLDKRLQDMFRESEAKVKKQIIETMLDERIDSSAVK